MKEHEFQVGEHVIYPSHKSIGIITSIEEETIAGSLISVYKVKFKKENMMLHVPINAATKSGLRSLQSKAYIQDSIIPILQDTTHKKDEVWRNCSTEYENKIHSGDLVMIAEVVRDLFNEGSVTYSRRNVYEIALERLALEISAIYDVPYDYSKERIVMIRRGLACTITEEKVSLKEEEEAFS